MKSSMVGFKLLGVSTKGSWWRWLVFWIKKVAIDSDDVIFFYLAVSHYMYMCKNIMADFRCVSSQWETALHHNDVSYWLEASLKSALNITANCIIRENSCSYLAINMLTSYCRNWCLKMLSDKSEKNVAILFKPACAKWTVKLCFASRMANSSTALHILVTFWSVASVSLCKYASLVFLEMTQWNEHTGWVHWWDDMIYTTLTHEVQTYPAIPLIFITIV